MDERNRTTSIRRPARPGSTSGSAGRNKRSSDLTTSIPRDKQLIRSRATRIVLIPLGVVLIVAVLASLFVLPIQDRLAQDEALASKRTELAALNEANARLAAENARLQTPAGIEEAAREEVGYVSPGERRKTVLPSPAAPLALPTGWPYDAAAQIIAVRSQPPSP